MQHSSDRAQARKSDGTRPGHQAGLGRRAFIRRAVAGAAGFAAVPMTVPRHVLGAQGRPGANDRIVLGAIGVGRMGSGLLPAFAKKPGCTVGAVSDVYLPRAQEVAAKNRVALVFQDYRALLERGDVDAVVIATPHTWHALHSIHAAQAGKDIYCEKPLTYSIAEGRRLVEVVRKTKRVLQTGSQQRSGRREQIGCMLVRGGAIGKVSRVLAMNYASPMEPNHPEQPIPEGLDWDRWCGPAEKLPYNFLIWSNGTNPSWTSIRPFGGGVMTDWGGHGLDMAQWGLDMDAGGPEEVWTEGEPFAPVHSTPERPGARHSGPQAPVVFMKYPGGIVMELSCFPGNDHALNNSGVTFIGERGSLTVVRGALSSNPPELALQKPGEGAAEIYRGEEYARKNDHHQDWLNAIRERRDPVAHAEAGHRSASVCHLGNIARWVSHVTGETGRKLRWDAQRERFTSSEEANRFVNPPRREGYALPELG